MPSLSHDSLLARVQDFGTELPPSHLTPVRLISYTARKYARGAEACEDLAPWGLTFYISTEKEFGEALVDPTVSCILLTESVLELSQEYWSPEVGRLVIGASYRL